MQDILVCPLFGIMSTRKTDKLDGSVVEWENYKHLEIHINMVSVFLALPNGVEDVEILSSTLYSARTGVRT